MESHDKNPDLSVIDKIQGNIKSLKQNLRESYKKL
jgi:hypothetical protein